MRRPAIGATLWMALGLVATPAPAQQAGTAADRPVNISRTATDSLSPVVAAVGETIHVAWIESEPTTDGLRATIWYVRSTDSGRSFEDPRPVAPLAGYASGLQCSVDGSTVHLAWLATSYTTGSPAAVDYQQSTDNGTTFEPFVAINDATQPGAPILVSAHGRVAVVWLSEDRLWMARSIDGGSSFDLNRIAGSAGTELASAARAVASSDGIAVAWLSPSGQLGRTLRVGRVDWQTGAFVEAVPPDDDQIAEVTIAASGDDILVAWSSGESERTVRAAWSFDGGRTFGGAVILGHASIVAAPRAAAGTSAGFVAWIDAQSRLSVAEIDLDGTVREFRLRSARRSVYPEIVGDDDGAIVAWRSGTGGSSLIRSCSIVSANPNPSVQAVAKRGRSAAAPRIAIDRESRIVVWQQVIDGAAEVFARRLPD